MSMVTRSFLKSCERTLESFLAWIDGGNIVMLGCLGGKKPCLQYRKSFIICMIPNTKILCQHRKDKAKRSR